MFKMGYISLLSHTLPASPMCRTGWSVASVTVCVCFSALLKENCLSYEHQTRHAWQSLGMHWPEVKRSKVKVTRLRKPSLLHGCLWTGPLRPCATYCCRHGLHVIWLLRVLVIWLQWLCSWTKWLVNAGQIDLIGSITSQISTDRSSDNAIDGDKSTMACTEANKAFPWWMIDLGATYSVITVTITLPDHGGGDARNIVDLSSFELINSVNGLCWKHFRTEYISYPCALPLYI